MLMRNASAPHAISLAIISRLFEEGPRVARILTLRPRGPTDIATINPHLLAVAGEP
jgi:hypothetical protein